LKIPRALALRHRYWDPFDLDKLYLSAQAGLLPLLPTSSWENSVGATLQNIVGFHSENFEYYYERYISDSVDERFIWAICLSAEQWAREASLREILEKRNFQEQVADKIDAQIDILMNKVVYGLPTLYSSLMQIYWGKELRCYLLLNGEHITQLLEC